MGKVELSRLKEMRLQLRGLLDRLAQGCGRGEVWGVVLEAQNPMSENPALTYKTQRRLMLPL